MDVLAVLKVLLQEDTLPFPTALVAILTSLKTLQGPGKELKIDEKEFITILYKVCDAIFYVYANIGSL